MSVEDGEDFLDVVIHCDCEKLLLFYEVFF